MRSSIRWGAGGAIVAAIGIGCATTAMKSRGDAEAQQFLDAYTATYQKLQYDAQLADWESNTHIVDGDDTNAKRTEAAKSAEAEFTGSKANIEEARRLLAKGGLSPLQKKQLEYVLYLAADNPQTVPDLVKARITAETAQVEKLFGFHYQIDGKEVSTNEIDDRLRDERDLAKRRQVWEASKEVGVGLRDGLEKLRDLRNRTVRALGYDDYFSYQVSDYGMTRQEMMDLLAKINEQLLPLYREMHTYFRYELAKRYGQPVPERIPAHWLPNRWGQDWNALVKVEGFDLDGALKTKQPEWLVKQAERFYVSLGFEPLPQTFWERSSLYPAPPDAKWKKNNHASAWHMDLDHDVRSLMSVEPNTEWYETTHHELGHIYYYLSYSNPDVPVLLREGANRAYHEGIGSMMGLAAMQPRFVAGVGLLEGAKKPDPMQTLLKEACNYVVFIPWSTGTMSVFEHDLYAKELSPGEWNARWWELAAQYQGIEPPSPRDEHYCDAATKTHINDDPAQYYDYALSYVLLFQIHDHIARKILHEDPHDTNYFGRKDVGDFLKSILRPGASADWRQLLREKTGEDLSARAMLDYFAPLLAWLKQQNAGHAASI
jgi:peptidyl-dipeptidase A